MMINISPSFPDDLGKALSPLPHEKKEIEKIKSKK
jgi:hypothetical protein